MIPGSRSAARHALALALGIEEGEGCRCVLCGPSPFPAKDLANKVIGANFVDWPLCADRSAEHVCQGCARIIGGKPSRENPPVRTGHFAVVGGSLERPDGARLVELLAETSDVSVIGWTSTRQRHASLRAGICGEGVYYIGTETDMLEWVPERDRCLLDAVSALRGVARREHILSGSYPPHVIQGLGKRWQPNEEVVAQYRPSLALTMAVAIVRRPDTLPEVSSMPVMHTQREAAMLLLDLVDSSQARRSDPIQFWSITLSRRLAAATTRTTLVDAVAYLMEQIQTLGRAASVQRALNQLEMMSEEDADHVLRTWRDQPRIVIAMTKMLKDEGADSFGDEEGE